MSSENKIYRNASVPGTGIEERMVTLSSGIKLYSVIFTPPAPKGNLPLVFFPGFASVIENFSGTLRGLSEHFEVHYFETREKPSSIVPAGTSFTVRGIAEDISGSVEAAGLEEGKYILLGYSLGATAAVEAFNSVIKKKPALLVLLEPSAYFDVPAPAVFASRRIPWIFNAVKPLVKFYIKTFKINTAEDYEMYEIIERIIDGADRKKLLPTLVSMSEYTIWDALKKVDVPTVVIGTSLDTFHSLNDALEISVKIGKGYYYDLVTNKRSHSPEVCDLLLKHLSEYPVELIYSEG